MADDLTNAPDVAAAGDASTVIPSNDSVGIRDIPDESGMIPASDVAALKSALERIKADNQDLKSKAKKADLFDELLGGADPAELRQKLAQLERQEVEEEQRQKKEAEVRLQTEREKLIDYISKATGKGGKARVSTDASRARKNIRQQVNRDIDRMSKFCPELAEHLRTAFQGESLCYRPTQDPGWQF